MKLVLIVAFLASFICLSTSEAPRFRQRFFARQEQAPYPPSGWRPAGPAFSLPTEQNPNNQYGLPQKAYGSPAAEAEQTTEPDSENIVTAVATAVAKGERLKSPGAKSERLTNDQKKEALTAPNQIQAQQTPFYYVLPESPFQKLVLGSPTANLQYYSKLQQTPNSPLLYSYYTPQYLQVY